MVFLFNALWISSTFCSEIRFKHYPGALHLASILGIDLKFWKWNDSEENKKKKKNPSNLKQNKTTSTKNTQQQYQNQNQTKPNQTNKKLHKKPAPPQKIQTPCLQKKPKTPKPPPLQLMVNSCLSDILCIACREVNALAYQKQKAI